MPSCREKGKGEQIHGRTQPLKHTIFVGVEYFPLGDLHVARVGQHQGGQEEATHLNIALVREQKKRKSSFYELKSKTSSLLNPPTMLVNGLKTPSPASASLSGSSLRILEPGKDTIKTKPICLRHFDHHIHECRSFSFAPPPPV